MRYQKEFGHQAEVVPAERGADMTVSERNARIAYLLKRKEALTWKWIGAVEEINAQLETLKATPTEGDTDESCTED